MSAAQFLPFVMSETRSLGRQADLGLRMSEYVVGSRQRTSTDLFVVYLSQKRTKISFRKKKKLTKYPSEMKHFYLSFFFVLRANYFEPLAVHFGFGVVKVAEYRLSVHVALEVRAEERLALDLKERERKHLATR